MNLENFPRFVVCSMIWAVVAVSVFATAVTALADPGKGGAAIAALFIVIPFGLIVAIPLGLVTLLLGRPILLGMAYWLLRAEQGTQS